MSLARAIRKPALLQLMLVAATSAVFFGLAGVHAALAAVFGGTIAAANLAWLLWRRQRAADGPVLDAAHSVRLLYRTVLERFALVAFLFVLGLGVLQLDPLAVLTGFITGQAALLFTETGRNNGHHGV